MRTESALTCAMAGPNDVVLTRTHPAARNEAARAVLMKTNRDCMDGLQLQGGKPSSTSAHAKAGSVPDIKFEIRNLIAYQVEKSAPMLDKHLSHWEDDFMYRSLADSAVQSA